MEAWMDAGADWDLGEEGEQDQGTHCQAFMAFVTGRTEDGWGGDISRKQRNQFSYSFCGRKCHEGSL
jgi:hypothetical protein